MATIDYPQTMKNLKLINKNELAKRLDVTPVLIHLVASGKYKFSTAPKAQKVLGAIRDLGMLAEVEVSEA